MTDLSSPQPPAHREPASDVAGDTLTALTPEHPTWCDPRHCGADSRLVGDRAHVAQGDDISLSLYDRGRDDYVPFVQVLIEQHVRDDAATVKLYSETVGHDGAIGQGFLLQMTAVEAEAVAHQLLARVQEARTA